MFSQAIGQDLSRGNRRQKKQIDICHGKKAASGGKSLLNLGDQKEQKKADEDCAQQWQILALRQRHILSWCKNCCHKGKAEKQNHKNGHNQMAGMVFQVKKPVFEGGFPKIENTGHLKPPPR